MYIYLENLPFGSPLKPIYRNKTISSSIKTIVSRSTFIVIVIVIACSSPINQTCSGLKLKYSMIYMYVCIRSVYKCGSI